MSYPSRGPRYLKETVNAVLLLIRDKMRPEISVKKIRRLTGVDGANRSVVMFYSRALIFLEREGIIKTVSRNSHKKYAVIDENKLNALAEGLNSS